MIENIEFTDKPKHRIVREFKRQKDKLLSKLVKECIDLFEKGELKENMDLEKAIEVIAEKKPELILNFQAEMEELNQIATISFATGRIWRQDEIDELTEDEFWELYEKSKEVLGGTAEDFLSKYDKVGFSKMNLDK